MRSTSRRSSTASLAGLGKPAETHRARRADPSWMPEIREDQSLRVRPREGASSILEEAGYKDTDGDGVREMPGGGQPLNFRYMVRSDGETGAEIAEFITGWLDEIGIATTVKVVDDSQLTNIIGKGEYDMFAWGWTPYVDPDTMLVYLTCDQVSADPEDPTNYYNDANLCDKEYDASTSSRRSSSTPRSAWRSSTRCSPASAADGRLQRPLRGARPAGLRKDRFTGWTAAARGDRAGASTPTPRRPTRAQAASPRRWAERRRR